MKINKLPHKNVNFMSSACILNELDIEIAIFRIFYMHIMLLTENGGHVKHLSENAAFRRQCSGVADHWPEIIYISGT